MNYSKGRKIYIALSAVVLVAVLIIIFCLSAQTGETSSATSGFFTKIIAAIIGQPINEATIRTLAHFCEFAGLGFLVTNLIFALKDKPMPVLSILLSWLYAWTDEIHQIFVPERAFQLIDLTVDLGGIVLGTILYRTIIFIITHKKSH